MIKIVFVLILAILLSACGSSSQAEAPEVYETAPIVSYAPTEEETEDEYFVEEILREDTEYTDHIQPENYKPDQRSIAEYDQSEVPSGSEPTLAADAEIPVISGVPSAVGTTPPAYSDRQNDQTIAPYNVPTSQSSYSGGGGTYNFDKYDNPDQQNTSDKYVLNTSTKKVHQPSCDDGPRINPDNYATSNESLESLLAQGYTPCGHCMQ